MTFSHLQLRLGRLVGLSLVLQQSAAALDDHDNADARQKPGGLGNEPAVSSSIKKHHEANEFMNI